MSDHLKAGGEQEARRFSWASGSPLPMWKLTFHLWFLWEVRETFCFLFCNSQTAPCYGIGASEFDFRHLGPYPGTGDRLQCWQFRGWGFRLLPSDRLRFTVLAVQRMGFSAPALSWLQCFVWLLFFFWLWMAFSFCGW